MLAPQYAVTAPSTDRVEIVVLRVALAAEPCIRVPASRAPVAVSIPCALGPPDLRFTQCRHFAYPCPCVEAARNILSAGTASASVNPRQVHVACDGRWSAGEGAGLPAGGRSGGDPALSTCQRAKFGRQCGERDRYRCSTCSGISSRAFQGSALPRFHPRDAPARFPNRGFPSQGGCPGLTAGI